MPAQIRPNRLEVTDRFPMLGFTIRTDGSPQRAEIAIATDPRLFRVEHKGSRTLSSFYSSRASGPLPVPRGEAVYVVPAEVLARFVGQEKLYVALATTPERNGQTPRVDVMPGEGAPYVSLRNLTGRSLRHMRVLPTRPQIAAGYGARDKAALEWTGDLVVPADVKPNGNGAGPSAGVSPAGPAADYDDGFGPMVAAPAERPVVPSNGKNGNGAARLGALPAPAPTTAQALDLSSLIVGTDRQSVPAPSVSRLPAWQSALVEGAIVGLSGPLAPVIATLPLAARAAGVSIGVGPAVGAGLGAGVGLGVGVVFGPDGGLGVYGAAEFQVGFLASISATAQITVVNGGIETFNGWGVAAAISGGEGIVGGAAALFDLNGNFQGVSLQLGVGAGLTPVDFYIAVQRQVATALALAQARHTTVPRIPGSHAQAVLALASDIPLDPGNGGMSIGLDALEIGDIIVSTTADAVSRGIRFATGSDVSHSMLYVGQGGQVVEATAEGVRLRPLADAIASGTVAVAFRYPNLSSEQRQIIADKVGESIGLPFNYWGIVRQARFQMHKRVCDVLPDTQAAACRTFWGRVDLGRGNSTEFFCSELIVSAYQAAGVPITDTPPIWTSPEDLVELALRQGALSYVGHLKAPPYEARTSIWDAVGLAMAAPAPMGTVAPQGMRRIAKPMGRTLGVVRALDTQHRPIQFPPPRVLSTIEREIALGALQALAPNLFQVLSAARKVASDHNISIAFGPAVGVGLGIGMGIGAGIIFAPNNEVGIYGQFDIRGGLIDSASAELQCTVVRGGIAAFTGVSFALAVEVDAGISVSGQALFDSSLSFQGVTFGLGVGLGIEPLQVFLAVQGSVSTTLAYVPRPRAGLARARAFSAESFTINWDEVQLIAQPTDVSCWAASGAMVVGWRDRVSLGPETIAAISGRTTTTGLDPAEVGQFAKELGLVVEPPQSYTVEAFRELLDRRGPLWVASSVPGLHAIVVTGMYSEGGNVHLRITDPWDRQAGTPGSPGLYADTHSTGSRYIIRWEDFVREYEAAATDFSRVNLQILHAGSTAGRTANYGSATGAGYAQAARRTLSRPRTLNAESFSVNWDEVEAIAQPTDNSCWAAAGAMVVGWRDRMSLSTDTIAEICGRTKATGLDPAQVGLFASEIGLVAEPPQSYTVDAFRQLLEVNGPLWVGASIPGLHVIVVTGLYADGPNVFVRVTDPLDREIGTPGTPGPYKGTHVTGSRYIMSWEDFVREYEAAATDFSRVNLQILHSSGASGRTPNYGSAASVGYAQSLRAARAAAYARRPAMAQTALPGPPSLAGPAGRRQEGGSAGAVRWTLDQYDGLRWDAAPSSTPKPALDRSVRLDDWPLVGLPEGTVQLPLMVSWRYRDGAVGDVRITPGTPRAVNGWTLAVSAEIAEGPDVAALAGLTITVRHSFAHAGEPHVIAVSDLSLFGDGTYQRRDRWEQVAA